MCTGSEQGDLTGRRLLEINLPYTTLIHSTMQRARETTTAIRKHLSNVAVVETDLLREGAPWPPEPPLSSWRPDYRVLLSISYVVMLNMRRSLKLYFDAQYQEGSANWSE